MGIGALLQDGLALGMLEVFCIRKSAPFERLYINGTHTIQCERTMYFCVEAGGGMDRVSPNLYAFIQLPKEALFAGKFLTTLHL